MKRFGWIDIAMLTLGLVFGLSVTIFAQNAFTVTAPVAGASIGSATTVSVINIPAGTTVM